MQGNTIPPKLLMACLKLFKKLEWDNIWIRSDCEYSENLIFSDGIFLLRESEENLQKLIKELKEEFKS